MKVTVPDQKLPVTFSLRAHVTTTDLVFIPSKLDFGPCAMGEATGKYSGSKCAAHDWMFCCD
jgi:hypothetical protein